MNNKAKKGSKSMKIVLVGGCFDLLHYGHITFLEQAKSHGDWLIVALESDENVRNMKGNTRPIHTQEQRKKMLEALTSVDEVIALPPMHSHKEYFDLVQKIHPYVIAVTQGDSYLDKKKEQATLVGAHIVVVPKIITPSTSQLAKLLNLE